MGRTQTLAGVIAAAFLCCCSSPHRLTVGSKNFTEQLILGEILAQQLERRLNLKVARKLNLGGTLLAQQALAAGQIDLYPEYTGTALTAVLKLPPSPDASIVLARVREQYRKRWNLEWLEPLGLNNSFAMVIRGPDARNNGLQTISDAARHPAGWALGVGYEFITREDGLAGLQKTYHLPLRGSPKTMDLGLLYKALEQNQVDMVAASLTDGMLSVLDAKVLQDDKRYFPPYEAAPVVRSDALAAHPGMREALSELDGKLPTSTMQKLNYQVDGKHRPVAQVAREFLQGSAR